MGVAARVAQERLEDVDSKPGTVGYAIRGERRANAETRLLFCTTGIVLRRLGTGDVDLSGVSHVIVDEAHERGVDTDLLICLLRDLLERNSRIKVILMSATINGEQLRRLVEADRQRTSSSSTLAAARRSRSQVSRIPSRTTTSRTWCR